MTGTEEISLQDLTSELEKLSQDINAYLTEEFRRFNKATGTTVTGLDIQIAKLTGGFPRLTVSSVIGTVDVTTVYAGHRISLAR